MTLKNMIELADGLTPIETEIGYYILKNQEDILDMSVIELAEKTFVSKSAIHRFCKKIGLKGFNELKVILAKDISEMKSDIEMIDVNYPFERKDGPQMIAKKLSKLYETAIYDTYDYMDFIELHKVAQLLHKAEVIDIYTHSHNMNVAENFQDKMLTAGKSSVECPHGFYKQRLTALASNPKHAAIILSYSGKATFVKPILKVLHQKIMRLYKADFTKYETNYKLKLREIYDSMPGQLDSKNKRFKINTLGKGLNYDRVANDFLWLKDAGVAIPVYNINEPKLPLIISENRNLFKLFFSDVGILTNQYSDQVKIAILNKEKSINNGALFENVVAQELLANGFNLYYFNNKKQGELDFVIELDGKVTPLEIKSGKDYKKHSALVNVLKDKNYEIEKAYIFSEGNVETKGQKIYMPIYMIMFLKNTELKNTIYKIDLSGL